MSAAEKENFNEYKNSMIESIRQRDLQIAFMGLKDELKDMFNDFRNEIKNDLQEFKNETNKEFKEIRNELSEIKSSEKVLTLKVNFLLWMAASITLVVVIPVAFEFIKKMFIN